MLSQPRLISKLLSKLDHYALFSRQPAPLLEVRSTSQSLFTRVCKLDTDYSKHSMDCLLGILWCQS